MTVAEYQRALAKSCATCHVHAGRPCRSIASGVEMPEGQVHAMRMEYDRPQSPPYGTPGDWTIPTE